ncbi:MAG TPA: Ig-like domain-containing protein [Gaiellaceae bacterium]|jgi:hypothetical protein
MRRRLRRLGLFGLLGLVWVLGVVSASSAASPGWGSAITVAVPGGGISKTDVVSCGAVGSCIAAGEYIDASGQRVQAFVVDQTHGTWGPAIEIPGVEALNTGGYAWITAAACASAGNCVVSGWYTDSNGMRPGFVVDETNGSWGSPVPAGNINSISCPAAGDCVAAGDGLLEQTNGTWSGSAVQVPDPQEIGVSGWTSVSCASPGNCVAGGASASGLLTQAIVANETNGIWGNVTIVPGSAALNSTQATGPGHGATVLSVSCPTAGNCAVGGRYEDSSFRTRSFVADETNGTWGTAIETPGTAALSTGNFDAGVYSVSCTSPGNCSAGGDYSTVPNAPGQFGQQAFVIDETNGVWGTAVEVPGTAALNSNGYANVNAVSCSAAGNCSAGGYYSDGQGGGGNNRQAFVIDETNGTWGTVIDPGTKALNTGDIAYVDSLSCAAVGYCAAAGLYVDDSGDHGFVVSSTGEPAATALAPASASGTYGGTAALSATLTSGGNGVSGATVSFTLNGSSVGDATTNATGVATLPSVSLSGIGAGSYATGVAVSFAGDGWHQASAGSGSLTVAKADQTITFATPADRTYGDANFDPGATSSSGGAVFYGASGACSIVGGTVHLTGAGSCSVTASQAGDADYNAAPQAQRTFSIAKAALSITAASRQKYFDQALALGTTAFTSSGLVGSDSIGGVTLTSSGAAANAASGNYAVMPSNAVAGPSTSLANYAISYHAGTLHVLPVGIIGLNGVSVTASSGKIDGGAALVMSNGALSFVGVSLLGSAISTHGSVMVSHSASVSGFVTAGTTASILGTAGGAVTQNAPSAALAVPTVAACSPFSSKSGISGGSFSYASGNLAVKGGTVKLAKGTYCFGNVSIAAGSVLSVSGQVTIHLRGKLTGKGQIANKTNLPANLHIDMSYTGSGGVAIVGGGHTAMTLLAPKTTVTISGGSFFGTVLARTVSLTGGIAFHAGA